MLLVGGYLVVCPYTKVEESFNIQAIHDMVNCGYFDLQHYDHNEFPGAVPRSFLGAFFISLILKPLKRFAKEDPFMLQFFARAILGAVNALSLLTLKRAIVGSLEISYEEDATTKKSSKSYAEKIELLKTTQSISVWYLILLGIQFHVPYYMSRTLPNFIAFPLTNFAFFAIFSYSYPIGMFLFAFTAITLRSEVALLLAFVVMILLLKKQVTLKESIVSVLAGSAVGLLISMTIDSYFWQKPLMLPEFHAFLYNIVEGNASNWGESSFDFYFTDSIPRLLNFGGLAVYGLILAGFITPDVSPFKLLTGMGYASLLFVAAYSQISHKEWRFIVYVVPVLTALVAVGIVSITNVLKNNFSKASKYVFMGFMGVIALLGFISSLGRLFFSVNNYEGGAALEAFHEILPATHNPVVGEPIVVHFDVPVAMSGVTKFGEIFADDGSGTGAGRNIAYEPWVIYDKTENKEELEDIADSFDYLIVSNNPLEVNDVYPVGDGEAWNIERTITKIEGFNESLIVNMIEFVMNDPKSVITSAYNIIADPFKKERTDNGDPFIEGVTALSDIVVDYFLNALVNRDSVWIYKRVSKDDVIDKPALSWDLKEEEEEAPQPTQVNDEL